MRQNLVWFFLIGVCATGCTGYHPRPILPAQTLEDFEARRLDAAEFEEFLRTRQGITDWPPARWDLPFLTIAGFYYSPEMDVIRAQWGVARGGMITAGARPNPTLTAGVAYNVAAPGNQITPWIPEAALDLPIEVAGKRGIRIREARQLSEAARLNILTAAWRVRGRIRQAFLGLFVAHESDSLLTAQQEIQTDIVRILENQLAVGEVSPIQVTQARVALANSRMLALGAVQQRARARSELADAIGVPPVAIDAINFSFEDLGRLSTQLPAADIRRQALVNRSDILSALAEYEASQAALQLEIRQQYPDINLGPGYQLNQSWTLLLGLVLPVLNRNQGPIAEAQAGRQEAAARFLAVQSRALGEVESAVTASQSVIAQVEAAEGLMDNLATQELVAATAYRVGEISRLELLGLRAEMATLALFRLDAIVRAQEAIGQLEDAIQSPLDVSEWVLETPTRISGSANARREDAHRE